MGYIPNRKWPERPTKMPSLGTSSQVPVIKVCVDMKAFTLHYGAKGKRNIYKNTIFGAKTKNKDGKSDKKATISSR